MYNCAFGLLATGAFSNGSAPLLRKRRGQRTPPPTHSRRGALPSACVSREKLLELYQQVPSSALPRASGREPVSTHRRGRAQRHRVAIPAAAKRALSGREKGHSKGEKGGKGEIGRKRTADLNREYGGEGGTRAPRRRARERGSGSLRGGGRGTAFSSPLRHRSARFFFPPPFPLRKQPRFDFSEPRAESPNPEKPESGAGVRGTLPNPGAERRQRQRACARRSRTLAVDTHAPPGLLFFVRAPSAMTARPVRARVVVVDVAAAAHLFY